MLRPSLHPSPTQREVGRNLALDLIAAVGVGVSAALVTTLLPTIARRGGLEPLGLAALAAAPFVANLLGAFAGRFGPRSTAQLAVIRGIGAASLLLLFFWPTAAVMIAVSLDLLAEHLVRRAVPPAPVGRDVPGPAPRPRRRACWGPAGPRPAPSPRSRAASSPTSSADPRRSRSRAPSASSAPSATPGSGRRPPSARPASRPANRSAPSASGRSSRASRSPRASTAAG